MGGVRRFMRWQEPEETSRDWERGTSGRTVSGVFSPLFVAVPAATCLVHALTGAGPS